MQTIRFLAAIATGWFLAGSGQSLPRIALLTVAASVVLTLLALVVQHVTLPPAARSRRGLTVFRGQLTRLLLGTIATIAITVVVVVFIRQRFG